MRWYRLFIIVVLSIIAASVIEKYFDYAYKKRWGWLYFDKINESISGKQNYDIIFLGNSRIHTGINPYYVDSITKLNSYNLAIGSGDEQEMKLLGTLYLQNHPPPKFVVLGLDQSLLVGHNILKERFAYLFYLNNDTVFNFMKEKGFPAGLIKTLPFLKYSFFDEYNRTSLFIGDGKIKKLFKHNYNKGFVNIFPDTGTDTLPPEQFFNTLPSNPRISDTSINTIQRLIEIFLAHKSRVIFVLPPLRLGETAEQSPVADSIYTELAEQYQLPMLRADKSALFTKKYFLGKAHLNEPGSQILSSLVADFINSLNQND
jgi:hypothetical protein